MSSQEKKSAFLKNFPKGSLFKKGGDWYLIKVIFYLAFWAVYGVILLVVKILALPFTLLSKKKGNENDEQEFENDENDDGGDDEDD